MSVVLELFYDTLYTGCFAAWCVLGHSLYSSFRHGVNRAGRERRKAPRMTVAL